MLCALSSRPVALCNEQTQVYLSGLGSLEEKGGNGSETAAVAAVAAVVAAAAAA